MPTPYSAICESCRGELEVTRRAMDGDGDVVIAVAPCESCLDEARQEVRDEFRRED